MQGDDSAPEGARRPGAADVPTEVRIAQGAIRLRGKLGEGLLDAFNEKYRESFELVELPKPRTTTPSPAGHPWGPMTVSDFVDLVVNELAIHAWDALSPLDSRLPHVAGVAARGAGYRKQDDSTHGRDKDLRGSGLSCRMGMRCRTWLSVETPPRRLPVQR